MLVCGNFPRVIASGNPSFSVQLFLPLHEGFLTSQFGLLLFAVRVCLDMVLKVMKFIEPSVAVVAHIWCHIPGSVLLVTVVVSGPVGCETGSKTCLLYSPIIPPSGFIRSLCSLNPIFGVFWVFALPLSPTLYWM